MAVLMGTANPRPSLPPPDEAICSLMPMTLPGLSISGPPELPWLIAASVWIPLGMRLAVRRLEAAPGRRDDARGDGEVVAERIADGHDRLADDDLVRVAERQRVEVHLARVHLDDRDVAADVHADELACDTLGLGTALVEHHGDAARTLAALVHDVRVGEDVALLVDHEAGAEGLGALRLAQRVGARRCRSRRGS